MTGAKSPGVLAAFGAIRSGELGPRVLSKTSQEISATLIGSDYCQAKDIIARGSAPVIALCRELVAAGFDSAARLDAWRGPTLCLRIRSIGEAAKPYEVRGTVAR